MQQKKRIVSEWLERWYRWSAPPMPPIDAPLAQRIVARRQHMISAILLMFAFLSIVALPLGPVMENPFATLLLGCMHLFIVPAIFCNRKGLTTLAGLLPIIGCEVILSALIINKP